MTRLSSSTPVTAALTLAAPLGSTGAPSGVIEYPIRRGPGPAGGARGARSPFSRVPVAAALALAEQPGGSRLPSWSHRPGQG